jgi:hypothetical protein
MTCIVIFAPRTSFLLLELASLNLCSYSRTLMRTKGEAKEEIFHPLSLLQYLIAQVQVDSFDLPMLRSLQATTSGSCSSRWSSLLDMTCLSFQPVFE